MGEGGPFLGHGRTRKERERDGDYVKKRKEGGEGGDIWTGNEGEDWWEGGDDLRRENIRWFLLSFPFFEEVFFLSLPRSTTTVCRYLDIP